MSEEVWCMMKPGDCVKMRSINIDRLKDSTPAEAISLINGVIETIVVLENPETYTDFTHNPRRYMKRKDVAIVLSTFDDEKERWTLLLTNACRFGWVREYFLECA